MLSKLNTSNVRSSCQVLILGPFDWLFWYSTETNEC